MVRRTIAAGMKDALGLEWLKRMDRLEETVYTAPAAVPFTADAARGHPQQSAGQEPHPLTRRSPDLAGRGKNVLIGSSLAWPERDHSN